MTDLKDLLRESAEADSGPGLDARAVLRDGQRRVRRRRNRTVLGVAAVVAAGAVVAGTGLLPSRVPQPATGPGNFVRVQVPRAEALRRCTIVVRHQITLNLYDESRTLRPLEGEATLDGRTVRQPAEPWYEGSTLYFTEPGQDEPYACTVPQQGGLESAGVLPTRMVTARHPDAFRDECGRYAGLDLTGWRFAGGATGEWQTIGLFVSRNGFTLQCRLGNDYETSMTTTGARPVVELGADHDTSQGPPAVGPTGNRVWVGCRPSPDDLFSQTGTCYGAGEAYDGRPVASLRVRLPDGRTATVPVHDGYYAFALPVGARAPRSSYEAVTITSLDSDGNVIAEHPVQPLPPAPDIRRAG